MNFFFKCTKLIWEVEANEIQPEEKIEKYENVHTKFLLLTDDVIAYLENKTIS